MNLCAGCKHPADLGRNGQRTTLKLKNYFVARSALRFAQKKL
jgi:hypothetical protein